MATLTIELPDEVLSHLAQTGHSPKAILLDGILQILADEPGLTATELASRLFVFHQVGKLSDSAQPSSPLRGRKNRTKNKSLPRTEIVRRLFESGFVRKPEEYDGPAAREWQALSETERQQHMTKMSELYYPDSLASNYIIESRR